MAKANNLSHDWLKFPTTSLHHSPGKQFFSFFQAVGQRPFHGARHRGCVEACEERKGMCRSLFQSRLKTNRLYGDSVIDSWMKAVGMHPPVSYQNLLDNASLLNNRLWALDFYYEIVDKGKARIKHRTQFDHFFVRLFLVG